MSKRKGMLEENIHNIGRYQAVLIALLVTTLKDLS